MKEYIVKVYETHTEWYNKKGQLHRENGPAREYINGDKEWFLNGQLHHENGPAVEWVNGYKEWWLNGQRHREDGPAVEYSDGTKAWWLNGKLHRENDPAIEYINGYKAWFLNGQQLTKEEFNAKTQVVEMTMEQVCKALGKNIKIIRAKE